MRVIIESPYAGDIERNVKYLDECIRDSIKRGEFPFASHKMYPGALSEETERQQGIETGYAWWEVAAAVIFYVDYGMSSGMKAAWDRCVRLNKPRVMRQLP